MRLRGRLEPGGRPMFGFKQNWEGDVMSFHEFIHALDLKPRVLGSQHGGGKGVSTLDAVVEGSACLEP